MINSNNHKVIWTNINSLIRNSKTGKPKIRGPNYNDFTGININNNTDLANHLNEYFSSVGSRLSSTISNNVENLLQYMGDRNSHSFFIMPCDADEVAKIMNNFSNECSNCERIPVFIYKILRHIAN